MRFHGQLRDIRQDDGRIRRVPRDDRPAHRKTQWVCVDDIGKIAAMAFNQPDKFIGKSYDIASDEMTMPQAAEIFSKVLGKTIVYQQRQIDESDLENAKRAHFVNDHGYRADVSMWRRLVPDLTSLESFVRKNWI